MNNAHQRRLWTSRRGIAIATMLTLAAFAITLATLTSEPTLTGELKPVAVQVPITK